MSSFTKKVEPSAIEGPSKKFLYPLKDMMEFKTKEKKSPNGPFSSSKYRNQIINLFACTFFKVQVFAWSFVDAQTKNRSEEEALASDNQCTPSSVVGNCVTGIEIYRGYDSWRG